MAILSGVQFANSEKYLLSGETLNIIMNYLKEKTIVIQSGSGLKIDEAGPEGTKISIDGVQVRTVTANLPDPPVATPYAATIPPTTPPGHSYNTVVRAAPTAQQVCVTALNVGSGSDKTLAKELVRKIAKEYAGTDASKHAADASK